MGYIIVTKWLVIIFRWKWTRYQVLYRLHSVYPQYIRPRQRECITGPLWGEQYSYTHTYMIDIMNIFLNVYFVGLYWGYIKIVSSHGLLLNTTMVVKTIFLLIKQCTMPLGMWISLVPSWNFHGHSNCVWYGPLICLASHILTYGYTLSSGCLCCMVFWFSLSVIFHSNEPI